MDPRRNMMVELAKLERLRTVLLSRRSVELEALVRDLEEQAQTYQEIDSLDGDAADEIAIMDMIRSERDEAIRRIDSQLARCEDDIATWERALNTLYARKEES